MASIERTRTGYAVRWRLGGKRTGAPQTLTIPIVPGAPESSARALAEKARDLAQAMRHAVTRAELEPLVLDDQPAPAAPDMPLFDEWVDRYVAQRTADGDIQPDTLARYEQILRTRAVPFLGHRRLDEITPAVIREWIGWVQAAGRRRSSRPLSDETIRRAHAVLHGCLAAAVPDLIPANPATRPPGRRIPGLPKREQHDAVFLDDKELAAILSNTSKASADLFFTLAFTGMRLGEAVALQVQDLNLAGSRPHIRVRRALKGDGSVRAPKSAKSVRDVDISDEVAKVLRRRVAGRRPTDLVFPAPRGGMWSKNNLRLRHWLPAVAAAKRCPAHMPEPARKPKGRKGPERKLTLADVSACGCPGVLGPGRNPRIHDLRHTRASWLIRAGWSPKEIQVQLGHASIGITMDTYGHLLERPDNRRVNEADRLMAGGGEGGVGAS